MNTIIRLRTKQPVTDGSILCLCLSASLISLFTVSVSLISPLSPASLVSLSTFWLDDQMQPEVALGVALEGETARHTLLRYVEQRAPFHTPPALLHTLLHCFGGSQWQMSAALLPDPQYCRDASRQLYLRGGVMNVSAEMGHTYNPA